MLTGPPTLFMLAVLVAAVSTESHGSDQASPMSRQRTASSYEQAQDNPDDDAVVLVRHLAE